MSDDLLGLDLDDLLLDEQVPSRQQCRPPGDAEARKRLKYATVRAAGRCASGEFGIARADPFWPVLI